MRDASLRSIASLLACALLPAGCGSTARHDPDGMSTPHRLAFVGTVESIDTSPWTYDGDAVVMVDAGTLGRVAVRLPARWNLCRTAAVDVQALEVGTRVSVVGGSDGNGGVVVCADKADRLSPAE